MKRRRASAFLCLAVFLDQEAAPAVEAATKVAAQTVYTRGASTNAATCVDDPSYVTKLGLSCSDHSSLICDGFLALGLLNEEETKTLLRHCPVSCRLSECEDLWRDTNKERNKARLSTSRSVANQPLGAAGQYDARSLSACPDTWDDTCQDDPSFDSRIGAKCVFHSVVDCTAFDKIGYTEEEVLQLIESCPCSCGIECGTWTLQPSKAPTNFPTELHSGAPSSPPSWSPTNSPSEMPSQQPSDSPTFLPSNSPSAAPSTSPSALPSSSPSSSPSHIPTSNPSALPSSIPSSSPSLAPTFNPSVQPSSRPSWAPTAHPSVSQRPSQFPSHIPSQLPSSAPSISPIAVPVIGRAFELSISPVSTYLDINAYNVLNDELNDMIMGNLVLPDSLNSHSHSKLEISTVLSYQDLGNYRVLEGWSKEDGEGESISLSSLGATIERNNSATSADESGRRRLKSFKLRMYMQKTLHVSVPVLDVPREDGLNYDSSLIPDASDLELAIEHIFEEQIQRMALMLRLRVSRVKPLATLTEVDFHGFATDPPTSLPTALPTSSPSSVPTHHPTSVPTFTPSYRPSATASQNPSSRPSAVPTLNPTLTASALPSSSPSVWPSVSPSSSPTHHPSSSPTTIPSALPSISPSVWPSFSPSSSPTNYPSSSPTTIPSTTPSDQPSFAPSEVPSPHPTTSRPSAWPSAVPTNDPSQSPSVSPSNEHSSSPSLAPKEIVSFGTSFDTRFDGVTMYLDYGAFVTLNDAMNDIVMKDLLASDFYFYLPDEVLRFEVSFTLFSQTLGGDRVHYGFIEHPLKRKKRNLIQKDETNEKPKSGKSASAGASGQDYGGEELVDDGGGSDENNGIIETDGRILEVMNGVLTVRMQMIAHFFYDPTSNTTNDELVLPNKHLLDNAVKSVFGNKAKMNAVVARLRTSNVVQYERLNRISLVRLNHPPTAAPSFIPTESPTGAPSTRSVGASTFLTGTNTPTNHPTRSFRAPTAEPIRLLSTHSPSRAPVQDTTFDPTERLQRLKVTKLAYTGEDDNAKEEEEEEETELDKAPEACFDGWHPTCQDNPLYTSDIIFNAQCENFREVDCFGFLSIGYSQQAIAELINNCPCSCRVECRTYEVVGIALPDASTSRLSEYPSSSPSLRPTVENSAVPSEVPSTSPSDALSANPTVSPSDEPSPSPSDVPSVGASSSPSAHPSKSPTDQPTTHPSYSPSSSPSSSPTHSPSESLSSAISSRPSLRPSLSPSTSPSSEPSKNPTADPISRPDLSMPTLQPSAASTLLPCCERSNADGTIDPDSVSLTEESPDASTMAPTDEPTNPPTSSPSHRPSSLSTIHPTNSPSVPVLISTSLPTKSHLTGIQVQAGRDEIVTDIGSLTTTTTTTNEPTRTPSGVVPRPTSTPTIPSVVAGDAIATDEAVQTVGPMASGDEKRSGKGKSKSSPETTGTNSRKKRNDSNTIGSLPNKKPNEDSTESTPIIAGATAFPASGIGLAERQSHGNDVMTGFLIVTAIGFVILGALYYKHNWIDVVDASIEEEAANENVPVVQITYAQRERSGDTSTLGNNSHASRMTSSSSETGVPSLLKKMLWKVSASPSKASNAESNTSTEYATTCNGKEMTVEDVLGIQCVSESEAA